MILHPIKIIVTIAIALAAGATIMGLDMNRKKVEAKRLVADAQELSQKGDSPAAVNEFLSKHARFMRRDRECSVSECSFSTDLKNTWLAFFRLAPRGRFSVLVTRKGDQLGQIYISAETLINGRLNAAVVLSLGLPMCEAACESFSVDRNKDASSGKTIISHIQLGPSATATERKLAFEINPDCIFRLGGCRDLSAITRIDFAANDPRTTLNRPARR